MNFNIQPYYDDFDKTKNFHRILFRPGYPVQARELNQIQSILQNQIAKFGEHFFVNGDKVYGGDLSVDKVRYVLLDDVYDSVVTSDLIGQTITGNITGVIATVIDVSNITKCTGADGTISSSPPTLFVKFNSTDSQYSEFSRIETLTFQDGTEVQCNTNTSIDVIGDALVAQIEIGIFFILGCFVYVEKQSAVLSEYDPVTCRYNLYPSCRVGLLSTEFIETPENDESLLDNSTGSSNYAAPGAHRYGIDSKLVKIGITEVVDQNNFYELTRVINGGIYKKNETNSKGAINESYLARRTYDESGDYVVNAFTADVREHRNNFRDEFEYGITYNLGDIVQVSISGTSEKSYYTITGDGVSGTVLKWYNSTDDGIVWIEDVEDSNGNHWILNNNPTFNNGYYDANGKITGFKVTDAGSGYTIFPGVKIENYDADGKVVNSGYSHQIASAIAVLDTSQKNQTPEGELITSVEDIVLTSPGSNYTGVPVVTIDKPTKSSGKQATAVATCDFGDESKLVLNISKGKAYVHGYEIEKNDITRIDIDKANEYYTTDMSLAVPSSQYVKLSNVQYIPDINSMETIEVINAAGRGIGTCRIISLYKSEGYHLLYFADFESYGQYDLYGNCSGFRTIGTNARVIGYVDATDYKKDIIGGISAITSSLVNEGSTSFYKGTITIPGLATTVNIGDVLNITATLTHGNIIDVLISVTNINTDSNRTAVIEYRAFVNTMIANKMANLTKAVSEHNAVCYSTSTLMGTITANTAKNSSTNVVTITSTFANYSSIMNSLLNVDSTGKSVVILHPGINPDYYRGVVTSQKNLVSGTNLQSTIAIEFSSTVSISGGDLVGGIISIISPSASNSSANPACIFSLDSGAIKSVESVSWSTIYATSASTDNTTEVVLQLPDSLKWARNDANDTFIIEYSNGTHAPFDITNSLYKVSESQGGHGIIIKNVPRNATIYAVVQVEQNSTASRAYKLAANNTIKNKSISNRRIYLGVVDAYELISVTGNSGFDYTDSFRLVCNADSFAYKESYIEVKPDFNIPSDTKYTVKFRYYKHIRPTDNNLCVYYDAESYKSFSVADIPLYDDDLITNYIDIRPDLIDDGTVNSYAIPHSSFSIRAKNVQVYMARRDRIALNTSGVFFDIKGKSSEDPILPDVPEDAMNIFNITVYPETSQQYRTTPVVIDVIDNRRYTMRDIGKLSKKIDTLQEYTTLSMLEIQTSTLDVGTRVKQGFVVDAFNTTDSNTRDNTKCHCSYDTDKGILRPPFVVNNVSLTEYIGGSNNDAVVRSSENYNYKSWYSKITLPVISETMYIDFTDATRAISVNPYNNTTYIGSVTVNPGSDDSFDQMTDILSALRNEYNDLSNRVNNNTLAIINNAEAINKNAANIADNEYAITQLRLSFDCWNRYWNGRVSSLEQTDNALQAEIDALWKRKYEINNYTYNTYNNTYNYNTYNTYNSYYRYYDNSY